jgi:hypothetical protein
MTNPYDPGPLPEAEAEPRHVQAALGNLQTALHYLQMAQEAAHAAHQAGEPLDAHTGRLLTVTIIDTMDTVGALSRRARQWHVR